MYIGTHHSNFNHQNLAAKGLATGWKVGIPLGTTYWPLLVAGVGGWFNGGSLTQYDYISS